VEKLRKENENLISLLQAKQTQLERRAQTWEQREKEILSISDDQTALQRLLGEQESSLKQREAKIEELNGSLGQQQHLLQQLQAQQEVSSKQLEDQREEGKRHLEAVSQQKDLEVQRLIGQVKEHSHREIELLGKMKASASQFKQEVTEVNLQHEQQLLEVRQEMQASFQRQIEHYQQEVAYYHKNEVRSLIRESQEALSKITEDHHGIVQRIQTAHSAALQAAEQESLRQREGLEARVGELTRLSKEQAHKIGVLERSSKLEREDSNDRHGDLLRRNKQLEEEVARAKARQGELQEVLETSEEELKDLQALHLEQQEKLSEALNAQSLARQKHKLSLQRVAQELAAFKSDFARLKGDVAREVGAEDKIREELFQLFRMKAELNVK